MGNGLSPMEILPWTQLLAVILQQGQDVLSLFNKEGGATKQDLLDLAAKHDMIRANVQAIVDAMPDTPAKG